MITSLEIKNFKSIKSLSVDLPRFAVLVGPNGSGKTNIVQAMELFGEILQRGTTDPARERGWAQLIRRGKAPARGGITLAVGVRYEPITYRGVSLRSEPSNPLNLQARLTLDGSLTADDVHVRQEAITITSEHSTFHVGYDPSGWKLHAGADPSLWDFFHLPPMAHKGRDLGAADHERAQAALRSMFGVERKGAYEAEPTVLRVLNRVRFVGRWISHLVDSCQVARFRLDASALRDDSSFREVTAGMLGPAGQGLALAVDRLRGHGKEPAPAFKRVLEALQKVYPRIEDIRTHRIQPGRLTLLFRERGISDDLGLANVSDGVLHALALLVMLEGGKDRGTTGILAIEEPEDAIHPWSVRSMMERAQTSSRQVLVTTHSETVVNAVKDPGSLFIVENDDRKGTIVTPARDKERALDAILSESGQRLGDVWMDGTLGGVPGR